MDMEGMMEYIIPYLPKEGLRMVMRRLKTVVTIFTTLPANPGGAMVASGVSGTIWPPTARAKLRHKNAGSQKVA